MPEFYTLSCPSCGAKLRISTDLERFACVYCGNEHVVKRSGDAVSLAPVIEQLKQVKTGVDKTASELAIKRLKGEIENLEDEKESLIVPSNFATEMADLLSSKMVAIIAVLFVLGIMIPIVSGRPIMDGNLCCIVSFVGPILLYVGLLVWGSNIAEPERKEVERKQATYAELIARKERELEKHQNIVKEN